MYTAMKIINKVLRVVMILTAVVVLAFAIFMIWDNRQVALGAGGVRFDWEQLKPRPEGGNGESEYDFDELLAVNPNVNGWITMDNTSIDYPVVKGSDNWYYLNRDLYGNYALTGSIFMDSRCAADYSDRYTILYGHHIQKHAMFSDLDLYRNKTFFRSNTTGTLLIPAGVKPLTVAAVIETVETTKEIFDPRQYAHEEDALRALCAFLRVNALHISEQTVAAVEADPERYQALALVTCAGGITGNRLILIVVTEYGQIYHPPDPDEPPTTEPSETQPVIHVETEKGNDVQTGCSRCPLWWIVLLLLCAVGVCIVLRGRRKEKQRKKENRESGGT